VISSALIIQQASATGVIYVRWGRTSCNSKTSQLIYKGYVGANWYGSTGGGANHLCLPTNPDRGSGVVAGRQESASFVGGVKYGFNGGYSNNHPFSYANNNGADLTEQFAPCAVCFNKKATTQYMIPAKQSCPSSDMTFEYSGYLAGALHQATHYRTEYICLDGAPEARSPGLDASGPNHDGGFFFPVQGITDSLPAPYVNYEELTCAVCTI